jgi:hypothetical protein
MAINKNLEFEELNGVKCGIVERNATPERVAFLKDLLEHNGFSVITAPSPPPKAPPPPKPAVPAEGTPQPETTQPETINDSKDAAHKPETFTIGVTDYTFNSINAIFGRQLKTKDGHIVTLAYWNQEEKVSDDERPYYE